MPVIIADTSDQIECPCPECTSQDEYDQLHHSLLHQKK